MIRKVGFILTIVVLVVNFFQPVVTSLPHREGAWMAPWPMQVVQAGAQSASMAAAAIRRDDLERWVFFAILTFLFSRFVNNLERTLEVINDRPRPDWRDR